MQTRRAPGHGPIARIAIAGAVALAVVVGCAGLAAISAPVHASDAHHAVVGAREPKANLVAATTTRTRAGAWVAFLLGGLALGALGAQRLRTRRGRDARRDLRRLTLRLRAPPALLVAH